MLISALVCLAAVSASVESKVDCAAQANAFAFSLANKLGFAGSKKNELISPISVNMDFTMLLNGTTGRTKMELAKALGWPVDSLVRVNTWASSVLKSGGSEYSAQAVFANAIFSRDIKLKTTYVQEMKRLYSAELGTLPSSDSEALAKINAWSNDYTKQRVPKILDRLNREDCLVLLNAVTFDGKWNSWFDSRLTRNQTFHSPGGDFEAPFMMNYSKSHLYFEDPTAQYLQLSYRGGRYAMLFILPKVENTLRDALSSTKFKDAVQGLKQMRGGVFMPRVQFSASYNLIPAFKDLGAKRLFQFSEDYGQMAPGHTLAGSQAVHRTFIEINEEGTKAGATTAISVAKGAAPGPYFSFRADRPYAIALYDTTSEVILFLGVVNKP